MKHGPTPGLAARTRPNVPSDASRQGIITRSHPARGWSTDRRHISAKWRLKLPVFAFVNCWQRCAQPRWPWTWSSVMNLKNDADRRLANAQRARRLAASLSKPADPDRLKRFLTGRRRHRLASASSCDRSQRHGHLILRQGPLPVPLHAPARDGASMRRRRRGASALAKTSGMSPIRCKRN